MVSSLAAAISDVALDAADRRLDCEYCSRLHYVALAHTWTSVGGAAWVGNVAGIRIRGNRCRDYRFPPYQSIAHTPNAKRTSRVKATASHAILVSKNLCASSKITFISFH
jgi:hypothetical protein